MNNPLISIIAPVYNVEDYLDRCVESIVNQTYSNLEIILVDDGSTDSSGKMCDEWKENDKRIIVIHKDNGGQGEARNYGLDIATGDYIGFVDSDDLISNIMFAELVDIAVQYQADLVGCRHVIFDDQRAPDFDNNNYNGQLLIMSRDEALEDIIREKHFESTVWNLLVKADIAKNVLFDVGKIHEDILWPFRVILKSNSIYFLEKRLYAYYQRCGSTMNSRYSAKRFDALDALETRAETIKSVNPDLYHITTRAYLGACMYHYQSLCREKKSKEYENYKSILHKRFCEGDLKALYNRLDLKYKIWFSMFILCPNHTCKLRNKLKIGK